MSVQIEIASEADAQTLLAMMRRLYEGEGFGLPARSPQALALLLGEPPVDAEDGFAGLRMDPFCKTAY